MRCIGVRLCLIQAFTNLILILQLTNCRSVQTDEIIKNPDTTYVKIIFDIILKTKETHSNLSRCHTHK